MCVGERKLAKMLCSGSLAPHFANNVCIIAEITYNPAHACHEVLTWSRGTCLVLGYFVWYASGGSTLYCRIMAVSTGSVTRGENIVCLLLWLPCQPGERLCCVRLCCCQKRINVSAVPEAPCIFFWPLS